MYKYFLIILALLSLNGYTQTAEETLRNTYKTPADLYSSDQYLLKGNTSRPVTGGVFVKKNDFVYIEITGKIRVGPILGEADGAGILRNNSTAPLYNKYAGHRHGAVMVLFNKKIESCKKILVDLGSKYKIQGITPDYGIDYVPGYYFIADEDGYLAFDINDREPQNNEGDFFVGIIIMSHTAHLARNLFNRCPEKEPVDGVDCFGNKWTKESMKSWYYHGVNDSYRGDSLNPGCQCVYQYFGDTLVTTGTEKGSFDIGYWRFKGNFEAKTAHYHHLILDVIPHDLYKERFGQESNYLFQQKIRCPKK